MKKIIVSLLVFGLIVAFSCKDTTSQKEAELARKEKELLEKEKDILKKENEALKSKQKKEEIKAKEEQPTSNNNRYSVEDIVGFWSITMTCTETDCRKNKTGDIRTETWQISQTNGKIIAKVSNSDTKVREYEGQFTGNTLTLKSSRTGLSTGKATVKISFQNKDELSGEREVLSGSSSDLCKIEYFIKAKRQGASPEVRF